MQQGVNYLQPLFHASKDSYAAAEHISDILRQKAEANVLP